MNILRIATPHRFPKLTFRLASHYHIDDLMTKKYSEKKSLVYKPALHLYKHKMLQ